MKKDKSIFDNDRDNEVIKELTKAINAQTAWLRANAGAATKADLEASEQRLLAAIRKGKATDAELLKLSGEIDASTAPLKAAVKENQPST